MILTYLAEAMAGDYQPDRDADSALRNERVAAFRLFLWHRLGVGETAVKQSQRTLSSEWLERLDRLVMIHLSEYRVSDARSAGMNSRVQELVCYHSDPEDCRLVAEAEALGVDCLVTFDSRLMKRLSPRTGVHLCGAAVYWIELGIPRGTPPTIVPAWTNPIRNRNWWHWD